MKNIVVLTGAGISADSGLSTFRDSDGLWANHRIEDVCTAEAMIYNRNGVIDFYNERRKELLGVKPNAAHYALASLQDKFNVQIITQNVDDLHERAGSKNVLHLHGELRKLRSSKNPEAIVDMDGWKQDYDTRHPDGSLLRPHIVFFGEAVPMLPKAIELCGKSDIFIVIGTSLKVYPAASLVQYIHPSTRMYVVDPGTPDTSGVAHPFKLIKERAAVGVPELVAALQQKD